MKGKIAWGIGMGLDGRDAARTAVQQAFTQLGTARPAAAFAFISQEYGIPETLNGLLSMLGAIPLWGFNTIAPFNSEGEYGRSVLLAILSGSDLKAQPVLLPPDQIDVASARPFLEQFEASGFKPQGLLLAADGVNPQLGNLTHLLSDLTMPISGCLGSGEYLLGQTTQIAGGKSAPGAIAALLLGDHFRISAATGHGWKDTGVLLQITQSEGFRLEKLDNLPANETLGRIFGYEPEQMLHSPHKELSRLYPLGIEVFPGSADLSLRSTLFVESDGSLRTNAAVTEGLIAHLMVGDPSACIQAAVTAARQAVQGLGRAQPICALVFADLAWQMLFSAGQKDWISALVRELNGIPMIGAYTLGQIARPSLETAPQLYNSQISITLIGQAE